MLFYENNSSLCFVWKVKPQQIGYHDSSGDTANQKTNSECVWNATGQSAHDLNMCSTGLLVFHEYFDIVWAYALLDGIDWLRLHDLRWISVESKIKSKFNTEFWIIISWNIWSNGK